MEKQVKKVFKIFTAWQDEKEENWLREMANKGWILEKCHMLVYTFVKSEPKDYVYKLDYKTTHNHDLDEYKTIFEDFGWEHVGQFGGWHYFRVEKENAETPDIYSDIDSKIQKYKGLMKSTLTAVILFLLPITGLLGSGTGYSVFVKSFYLILFMLWGTAVIRINSKIKHLKKESHL